MNNAKSPLTQEDQRVDYLEFMRAAHVLMKRSETNLVNDEQSAKSANVRTDKHEE